MAALEDGPTTNADAPAPQRPSEPIMPGRRYALGPLLGRGGMGQVFTAHDRAIGREVAIKTLRSANPPRVAVRRFLREARIQGRLDHPAIVPVYELARDDRGQPFFAMKKVNGTTLDERIGKAPRQQLLRAFVDVCLAVELAHTRGVVHRDLKPTNIALGDFGEVYVLDWGVARMVDDIDEPLGLVDADALTRAGTIVGTLGYMAPEQLAGERVDARADVYALGCVLFEILAGRPLHPSNGIGRHPRDVGVDPRPGVEPELDALCTRATAPDREQRLASARALADEVERYLDGNRDIALRGRIARDHLVAARHAPDPQLAMREALKALALDPQLDAAASLISELMLAPPAAARAEVARLEAAPARQFTRNLLQIHLGGALCFVLLWAFGVHDPTFLATSLGVSAVGFGLAALELRTGRALFALHNLVIVALAAVLARAFTPFLIAPAMIGVNAIACAFHPGCTRPRILVVFTASCLAGVLGVYALELLGVLDKTVTWANGTLALHAPLTGIENLPAPAILCGYLVAVVASGAALAWTTARLVRTARTRSHLQAWQLQQLLER